MMGGCCRGGSAECKRRKAEGFPLASDKATSHIVFIAYELGCGFIEMLPYSPRSTLNLPPSIEAWEACLSVSGSIPLPVVQVTTPNCWLVLSVASDSLAETFHIFTNSLHIHFLAVSHVINDWPRHMILATIWKWHYSLISSLLIVYRKNL